MELDRLVLGLLDGRVVSSTSAALCWVISSGCLTAVVTSMMAPDCSLVARVISSMRMLFSRMPLMSRRP